MKQRKTHDELVASIEALTGDRPHYSILGYWWVHIKMDRGRVCQLASKRLVLLEKKVKAFIDQHVAPA